MLEFLLAMTLQGQVVNEEDLGVIGVRINVLSDTISEVHSGCPAQEAGLLPGDRILTVDGKGGGEITGKPDTYVAIKIKRGKLIITYLVKRKALHELPQLKRSSY